MSACFLTPQQDASDPIMLEVQQLSSSGSMTGDPPPPSTSTCLSPQHDISQQPPPVSRRQPPAAQLIKHHATAQTSEPGNPPIHQHKSPNSLGPPQTPTPTKCTSCQTVHSQTITSAASTPAAASSASCSRHMQAVHSAVRQHPVTSPLPPQRRQQHSRPTRAIDPPANHEPDR